MRDKRNLNYGGATWHVFINLLLGIIFVLVTTNPAKQGCVR